MSGFFLYMWTIQQQKAIYKTDSDLLLTASAGSGKTAVLTERFLELIINPQNPCDIDKILVVTFTRAAVAEMRKRIGDRLLKHVEDNPNDFHARRQLSMLNCAKICTIDSYSSSLLKEYFYLADIDPSFEIIDPKEKSLILSNLIDEILEEFYSGQAEIDINKFYNFVRAYGGRRDDSQVPAIIRSLGFFIDSLIDSENLLNFCEPGSCQIEDKYNYFQKIQHAALTNHIELLISQLSIGENLLGVFSTVGHYREYISPTLEILQDAHRKLQSYSGDVSKNILNNIDTLPVSKRLSSKSKGVDINEKEAITYIIKNVKETLKRIPAELLIDSNTLIRQINAVTPHIEIIIKLYTEFDVRYQQYKKSNKVLDYSDISRKLLAILNDNGRPSIAAIEQQKLYKYILVDEYQDISPLQEALFEIIKKPDPQKGNMFMVGDLKQSIYRFRQADPDIILSKHKSYQPTFDGEIELEQSTGVPSRIELSKNFRSREEIINFVNYVFEKCISKEFGGYDYSGDGRMLFGASFYDEHSDNYKGKYDTPIELHLIDNNCELNSDNNELCDSTRREAAMVANRIRQIVDSSEFNILCPSGRQIRPVTYKDIVILLRSPKSQAQIYSEVFDQCGIPLFVQQEGGFFDSVEISNIMSILQLIDNPRQDIALAAALRSFYVGLTEDNLAHIRDAFPDNSFYSAVMVYIDKGSNDSLRSRLAMFLEDINLWRDLARSGTLAALIRNIYSHTNMLTHYRGMPDGRQRYANLIHLYNTAKDYDSFSTQGLGRFLRFIEDLSSQPSEDFGPAHILSESDNVVQLMSVHKSKGLEFPVVIAAGLGKKFNLRDLSKPVFFAQAEEGGIALRLRDPATGESWKTLPYAILTEKERLKCLYEEMRVQYVSLTRAKEHLILFADTSIDKLSNYCSDIITERRIANIAAPNSSEKITVLPANLLASAKCPLDWYAAALSGHPDFEQISGISIGDNINIPHVAVQVYNSDIINDIGSKLLSSSNTSNTDINIHSVLDTDQYSGDSDNISRMVKWQYPNLNITSCQARASVTAMNATLDSAIEYDDIIDHQKIVDDTLESYSILDFSRKPLFMETGSGKISAAEKGVLTHRFIELLDLTSALDTSGLTEQLENMVSSGNFTARQAKNIDLESIETLFNSDIGTLLISRYDTVYREWEFTLKVAAADEVYPEIMQIIDHNNDIVIVRGIIDCLVWDGRSYTIIDFKTDNVKGVEISKRAAHYKFQLDFYSRAVKEITGNSVSNCYLYFLKPGQSVKL